MHTRNLLIHEISLLAMGPSPFDTDGENPEFYERRRKTWYSKNKQLFDQNIASIILAPPPPSEYAPSTKDGFELEVLDVLTLVDDALKSITYIRITSAFQHLPDKSFGLNAIAALGGKESWSFLSNLNFNPYSKEELISFVHAIGNAGNKDGIELLNSITASDPDILNEINCSLAILKAL